MSLTRIAGMVAAAPVLGAALVVGVTLGAAAGPAPPEPTRIPTRLTVTAPASVAMGEAISVEARLTTADGRPVPSAVLDLVQVGAVGLRRMARATTDENGAAEFHHAEYTLAYLVLRVAYEGDLRHGPAAADTNLDITGIETPPAVSMRHTPDPLVKGTLILVLGAVWMTYAFGGLCIYRIVHDGRDARSGKTARTRRPLRSEEGER